MYVESTCMRCVMHDSFEIKAVCRGRHTVLRNVVYMNVSASSLFFCAFDSDASTIYACFGNCIMCVPDWVKFRARRKSKVIVSICNKCLKYQGPQEIMLKNCLWVTWCSWQKRPQIWARVLGHHGKTDQLYFIKKKYLDNLSSDHARVEVYVHSSYHHEKSLGYPT